MATSAVIAIGGDPFDGRVLPRLPEDRFTIAADSGLDHARRAGLDVDLVIGDLDSVTPESLAAAEAAGVPVERHRPDKDAVDFELAIDLALVRGHQHIVVLAGGGDRLDHWLAALLLLARADLAARSVEAWWGEAHVDALHGPTRIELTGPPARLVSLVPVHGRAIGVTTSGMRFPLHDEDLPAGTSRGVSNELTGGGASVALRAGTLLVIVPHALGGAP